MKNYTCVCTCKYILHWKLLIEKEAKTTHVAFNCSFLVLFILSDHENIQHPTLMILFFLLSLETLQRFLMGSSLIRASNPRGKNI